MDQRSTFKPILHIFFLLGYFIITAGPIASQHLYRIVEKGKVGFVDRRGKVIVRPRYPSAGDFKNGFVAVHSDGEKSTFLNGRGKPITKTSFSFTWGFTEGLAAVEIDEKWGYMNVQGELVIDPVFIDAGTFSGGLAPVAVRVGDETKFGYIDLKGNFAIKPQFVYATEFVDGVAAVVLKGRFSPWEANMRLVDGNYGFINTEGKVIIEPFENDYCGSGDGLICVSVTINGVREFKFIDHFSKSLETARFAEAKWFSNGLAAVKDYSEKWGFIDTSGRLVIGHQFSDAQPFSDGLAPVEVNDKWGYIDKAGTMIIQPQYDYAYGFVNGLAQVLIDDDHFGLIDEKGTYIWKPK